MKTDLPDLSSSRRWILEFIYDHISNAIASDDFGESDRRVLFEVRGIYTKVIPALILQLSDRKDNDQLIAAIEASFKIGMYVQRSPKSRIRLLKSNDDQRVANARFALEAKTNRRDKELEAANNAETKKQNKALAVSREFSELIRPGVRARLGPYAKGNYPSISKIKTTVSRMKNRTAL
jgi:hypothetical protein